MFICIHEMSFQHRTFLVTGLADLQSRITMVGGVSSGRPSKFSAPLHGGGRNRVTLQQESLLQKSYRVIPAEAGIRFF